MDHSLSSGGAEWDLNEYANKILLPREKDKRIKLTEIRIISIYGVDKRLIQFIKFPERQAKNLRDRQPRGETKGNTGYQRRNIVNLKKKGYQMKYPQDRYDGHVHHTVSGKMFISHTRFKLFCRCRGKTSLRHKYKTFLFRLKIVVDYIKNKLYNYFY